MRVDLVPGASFDTVSNDEMRQYMTSFERKVDEAVRSSLHGIKPMLFEPISMPVSGGSFSGILTGPNEGYYWLIRRISVWGVAAADVNATVINMFRGDSVKAATFIDQLTANKGWYASADGLILRSGETIFVSGTGAATTNAVAVNGSAVEVPSEMIGKLL